jgi:hypothetical protein
LSLASRRFAPLELDFVTWYEMGALDAREALLSSSNAIEDGVVSAVRPIRSPLLL